MRIRNIKINSWRHFEKIELDISEDASLVCIVGANGTGKSHILELISACAHRLGLSQGIEIPRGDPFNDHHHFSLKFYLASGVSESIDQRLINDPEFNQWDRTLTIESINLPEQRGEKKLAGGIQDHNLSTQFADRVTAALQDSQDVHFLSLDANRAYPKRSININDLAQAYEIDWQGSEYTKGRSFRPTTMLYEEWIKFFLAQENQSGTRLIQQTRRSRKLGENPPVFEDHFEGYAIALQKVLPHLLFIGADPKKRTLQFDSTGLELSFDQLSGGEREIAFLVGQIDRFGLRRGLFLIDEPELHLNSDLIRSWVAYLTSTVSLGQIWLATHSLEAVEAAGPNATFILERNEHSRKVDSLARLDSRPVLSALSRAVGTPAFSISQLRFFFVEGEESLSERERFRKLANVAQDVRFMECGSCTEVIRRVSTIKALADEADANIRIGGIIDRDFRADIECKNLTDTNNIFVLPVHEVENLFLHPKTFEILLNQNGVRCISPIETIRNAADVRAGSWIFQNAMALPQAKSFSEISASAKECAKRLVWTQIDADKDSTVQKIVDLSGFPPDDKQKFTKLLISSIGSYESKRQEVDFWRSCEGKQVINEIARVAGFADKTKYMSAVFALWERDATQVPQEVNGLRAYIAKI